MSFIPSDEIREVAVRKLYAIIGPTITDYADIDWEDLPAETKQLLYKAASIAGASTPAPIVVRCEHAAPFPYIGNHRFIYVNNTKEGIDAAVEQFRAFLTRLSDEWTQRHEEPSHG